jgi:hypothetical protein
MQAFFGTAMPRMTRKRPDQTLRDAGYGNEPENIVTARSFDRPNAQDPFSGSPELW